VEKINKIKELLALLSPKFLLDHYWEILNLVAWRIFDESENRETFTLTILKEKLLADIQKFQLNPITHRSRISTLRILEQAIDELLRVGLITKDENVFRKASIFPEFFYFLKNHVRTSVRKRVSWALWYAHHSKGLNRFSAHELTNLISYSNKECEEELSHLVIWVHNGWFKLLEKCNDNWRLLEEPYRVTKPILLTDLNYKLKAAILEISKFKDKFSTREIIDKLRELESVSIEKVLRRIGLKQEKDTWHLNDHAIRKIEDILFKPAMQLEWPLFGVRPSDNPYFKIEGEAHRAYVDVPNLLITQFLTELDFLSEKYGDNLEKLYADANKLKDEFNDVIKEIAGKWLSISIIKEMRSKKPFGIRIRIEWDLFQKFLKDFAKKDISLAEKYRYLSMCRSEITFMRNIPQKELMEERVKSVSKYCIQEIDATITYFIDRLEKRRKKYREKLLLKSKIRPLLLAYLPDMILTFKVIRNCIKEGAISTCYREMRKILETLSWVIVDDILLFKKNKDYRKKFEIMPPLRVPSKEWYEWARNKGLIAKSLSSLFKPLQVIIKEIGERYKIERRKVEKSLFNSMTYPFFLALLGVEEKLPDKLEGLVPSYEIGVLKPFIKETLTQLISQLKRTILTNSDNEFIEELTKNVIGNRSSIIMRYPSNSFIIQLLEKISGLDLHSLYEEYSYFVHSYDEAWQFYPFSSVLEFEIFKHEIIHFTKLTTQLLEFYESRVLR
jgi:hypothetical protein